MENLEGMVSLNLEVPANLGAWEPAQVQVVIHNALTKPVLPVELKLSTDAGLLESWGVEGRITYWSQRVPGRKSQQGWEILLDPVHQTQQVALPASDLFHQATGELLRLEPLLPGGTETLVAPFEAAYVHGDQATGTLRYLVLDPHKQRMYTVHERPSQLAFVRAEPVDRLLFKDGNNYYLPIEELALNLQTLEVSQSFTIRHPDFDVGHARQRTGVAEGPFGYDPAAGYWILVNPDHSRTFRVGAAGPILELPGDWLQVMMALRLYAAVDIYWQNSTAEEATRIRRLIEAAGMKVVPYTHKGQVDATLLVITANSADLVNLGGVIEAAGKQLDGYRVEGQ